MIRWRKLKKWHSSYIFHIICCGRLSKVLNFTLVAVLVILIQIDEKCCTTLTILIPQKSLSDRHREDKPWKLTVCCWNVYLISNQETTDIIHTAYVIVINCSQLRQFPFLPNLFKPQKPPWYKKMNTTAISKHQNEMFKNGCLHRHQLHWYTCNILINQVTITSNHCYKILPSNFSSVE